MPIDFAGQHIFLPSKVDQDFVERVPNSPRHRLIWALLRLPTHSVIKSKLHASYRASNSKAPINYSSSHLVVFTKATSKSYLPGCSCAPESFVMHTRRRQSLTFPTRLLHGELMSEFRGGEGWKLILTPPWFSDSFSACLTYDEVCGMSL